MRKTKREAGISTRHKPFAIDRSETTGITLIALVVTIVILLILAGITIGTLTGENGLIKQAQDAKTQTEIAEEREVLDTATVKAMAKDRYGNLQKEKLDNELNKSVGENKYISEKIEEGIAVTFTNSNRSYLVDIDGNIEEFNPPKQTPIPNKSTSVSEIHRGKSSIDVVFLNKTSYEISENPNEPKLDNTMVPVYYDESANSGTGAWIVCDSSDIEHWYNYEQQEGNIDGKTSRWANVMLTDDIVVEKEGVTYSTEDIKSLLSSNNLTTIVGGNVTTEGSMLVWIPRYAYKITYYDSSSKIIGYSDSRGIVTAEGETPSSYETPTTSINVNGKIEENNYEYYRVHPAFENGISTEYSQGEWDSKLTGIWVGKFEATGDISAVTTKSNTKALTHQTIGTMYQSIKENFKAQTTESHMIKNSEWGAIAYLTKSKYGRNGTEISKNNGAQNAVTGQGNYKSYTNQSTTGNVYGIYDLRGGESEWVSSYIANSNSSYGKNGYQFASKTKTTGSTNDKEDSTKYSTVYPYEKESASATDNYSLSLNKIFGDAIVETSTTGNGGTEEYFITLFFSSDAPFIVRGLSGNKVGSQLASFESSNGAIYADLFGSRVVCVVK